MSIDFVFVSECSRCGGEFPFEDVVRVNGKRLCPECVKAVKNETGEGVRGE